MLLRRHSFLILLTLVSIHGILVQSQQTTSDDSTKSFSFVLLGASGDLSKREIYPALWYLYRDKLLPKKTQIFGYAKSNYTVADIRERVKPYINCMRPGDEALYEDFWAINSYLSSSSNQTADYEKIGRLLDETEKPNGGGNRLFYFAIPPSAFVQTAADIKTAAMAKSGWTRIVVEKPFGRDTQSSEELSHNLTALFKEDQIYRMDHFLGYEMVQNLLTLRFANRVFESSWNSDNIAAIKIDFRENFGIENRGGYFDKNGIIRDVMQNHLLQIMSLIAMEKPKSMNSDDIRDAKLELLNSTKAIVINDVVIGQYIGNPESADPRERIGYREDPTVANNSITATFALVVLRVENQRWKGVPFIIGAGKGLDVNSTKIIVQYKNVTNDLFSNQSTRNELVINIHYLNALQVKLTSKTPGTADSAKEINVNFDYEKEFKDIKISGAYEKLIPDIINGNQKHFVRTDELSRAWKIFTPILHKLENEKIVPINYKFGSSGPKEADEIEKSNNFLK